MSSYKKMHGDHYKGVEPANADAEIMRYKERHPTHDYNCERDMGALPMKRDDVHGVGYGKKKNKKRSY